MQIITNNFNPPDDLVAKYSHGCNRKSMNLMNLGKNLTDITRLFEANSFLSTLKINLTDGINYLFLSLTSRR